MSKLTPTRFGIVGCGRITQRLVADLQAVQGVSVTAIASRATQRARDHAKRYGIEHAVTGYDALLERDDVDAVYIALPPSLHAPMTIAAANAGKHVLCEKPLGLNADEVRKMLSACDAAGVRFLDATAWLHHDRTRSMTDVLRSGSLGPIRHVSASVSFINSMGDHEHRMQAELGGGCLLDLGWYAAGMARYVMDAPPLSVKAQGVFRNGVPVRVTGMMRFSGEVWSTLSCGFDTATRRWFEIAGRDASIVCDDFTRPWPDKPARYWIHDTTGSVGTHTFDGSQEQAMIVTLVSNADLSPFHQQALQTQAILDALQESLVSDREVFLETPS